LIEVPYGPAAAVLSDGRALESFCTVLHFSCVSEIFIDQLLGESSSSGPIAQLATHSPLNPQVAAFDSCQVLKKALRHPQSNFAAFATEHLHWPQR
jgi:hypothetical protein